LTGNSGQNALYGGLGNDTLEGGLGADTLAGGAGDDVYYLDQIGDVLSELADEGLDTVHSSMSYTLGLNLEQLVLTGVESLSGTGNELENALTGNSGNNQLSGGAAHDTLDGGLGADTLIGGADHDAYYVDQAGDVVIELAGEGYDSVYSSISLTLVANVDRLYLLGDSDLNGAGNSMYNRLVGNSATTC